VTHLEAIVALLKRTDARQVLSSDPASNAAERHVGQCSDCWSIFELLDAAVGRPSLGTAAPEAFHECEGVQSSLYLFVGLSPEDMRARHPAAVRHLGWCLSCRERFATLLTIERELDELGIAADAAEASDRSARPQRVRVGDGRVRDLIGPLVVAVSERLAAFIHLPDGVFAAGSPFLPEPARGDRQTETALDLTRTIVLPLAESGLIARIAVDLSTSRRVSLEVSLEGPGGPHGTVALRAVGDDSGELLALTTIPCDGPARLNGVAPGKYAVEIRVDSLRDRFRTTLEIAETAIR
jgi:hypothetical protein